MIAVLGAGPHGREVARLLHTSYLYDDNLPGYDSVIVGATRHKWVVGAIWPVVRKEIAAKATDAGVGPHHDGTVVFTGARISQDASLGRHCHVGFNAVISHGCTLGDFVTVCAGAVLCGEVAVDDDVFIGANATVIHGGIRIGRGAVIGAGAVVTRDVPAGATVKGVPACSP